MGKELVGALWEVLWEDVSLVSAPGCSSVVLNPHSLALVEGEVGGDTRTARKKRFVAKLMATI